MEELKNLYYDPKNGYVGASKLYQKLKGKYTLKEIQDFLNKQEVYQVTKHEKKQKEYNSIVSPSVGNNYQIDIMIYDRYAYHGYKYILCCVDVYSRFVDCKALTNRKNTTIMEKLKEIFKDMGLPKNINCDNEFDTTEFKKYCTEHNITVWYSLPDEINKNAIVERFNRTLAELLQRWRVGVGRYDWNNILPDIVDNYNHTLHGTTKQTPYDVFNKQKLNHQTIKVIENIFKVGDKVRIKVHKKIFDKGDILTYSKDTYLVTKIEKNKVYLDNNKYYKPYELKKINEIAIKEEPKVEQKKEHEKTQIERRITRQMNKEGIKGNKESIKRNLRERKPNQLTDNKYGVIKW